MINRNILMVCIALLMLPCYYSCKKEVIKSNSEAPLVNASEKVLKERFAKILSKAVHRSPELRNFIKQEALKEVDLDNDVIYHWVKDEKISGSSTLRDILAEHEENEGDLAEIEAGLPTLTILVPTLPGGINAYSWKSGTETPVVATNAVYEGNVPMFDMGEVAFTIPGDEIPGFPLLVVKDNERIKFDVGATTSGVMAFDRSSLLFTHENFNGLLTPRGSAQPLVLKGDVVMGRGTTPRPNNELKRNTDFLFEIHPKINEAETIFPAANGGWQRDRIYYNLDNVPEAKGAHNKTFVETICAVRLKTSALALMMDQDDPTYSTNDIEFVHNPGDRNDLKPKFWTDGSFELKIDVLFNNLNGPGSLFPTVIPAKGDELYYADYDKIVREGPQRSQIITYKFKNIVPRWFYCHIPITEWDIEKQSVTWMITMLEVDNSDVITQTYTHTSKFATNFDFDLGVGNEKVKIGLKFGLSQEDTQTSTFTLQRTAASDELGSALVNFWDPILVNNNPVPIENVSNYDFLVDLTKAARRESAISYANLPPYDKQELLNTGTPRDPIPAFWAAEQAQIKAESQNRRDLSDFYKVPGANFELIMMPVYKF